MQRDTEDFKLNLLSIVYSSLWYMYLGCIYAWEEWLVPHTLRSEVILQLLGLLCNSFLSDKGWYCGTSMMTLHLTYNCLVSAVIFWQCFQGTNRLHEAWRNQFLHSSSSIGELTTTGHIVRRKNHEKLMSSSTLIAITKLIVTVMKTSSDI